MKTVIHILIMLTILWAVLRWFEWKNLYFPRKVLHSTPADANLAFEDVTFVTQDDHTIHGWWIPYKDAEATVIFCHGNAGNISDRVWLAEDLNRMGVNVFMFDYRGYGKSKGLSTEKGLYEDADAAFEWVRTAQYDDADNPPVFVYGRSLGGAVALELALRKPVKGVILECTFTSANDMAKRMYALPGLKWVISQRFDALSKIKTLEVPVLIAHGRDDDLVPFEMGQTLFESAQTEKQFVPLRGGHNDAGWHTTPGYWETVREFMRGQ